MNGPPRGQAALPWRARQALFLAMAGFVAFVQGPTNAFWVWNSAPIAVSYLLLRNARERNRNPMPEIAFFVVACGAVLVAHAAWLETPGGLPDGPVLALLPLAAMGGGAAAFFLTRRFTQGRS